MLGGRKVRSNKGKKRGPYKARTRRSRMMITVSTNGTRNVRTRKVRSNKGKKRTPYGPRTGVTRSGRKFRGGGKPEPLGWSTTLANGSKQLAQTTDALKRYAAKGCKLIEYNRNDKMKATGIKVKDSKVKSLPHTRSAAYTSGIEAGWKLHFIGDATTGEGVLTSKVDNDKINNWAKKKGWDPVQTLWCPN